MRCQEIQERFVDLLYQEPGTPSAGKELQEHLKNCPACQKELAGLQSVQTALKAWQDEPPLRPFRIPRAEPARRLFHFPAWNYLRYAAIAVLAVFAFLGFANADIQWDKSGFSFKTHLLSQGPRAKSSGEYLTKEENIEIIKRAMAISQDENYQMSYQMIQRALEYVDYERSVDSRYVKDRLKQIRVKN